MIYRPISFLWSNESPLVRVLRKLSVYNTIHFRHDSCMEAFNNSLYIYTVNELFYCIQIIVIILCLDFLLLLLLKYYICLLSFVLTDIFF